MPALRAGVDCAWWKDGDARRKSQPLALAATRPLRDVARLVYAAHLCLVEDAYRATQVVRLEPARGVEDIMGPDGYRTAIMFQVSVGHGGRAGATFSG